MHFHKSRKTILFIILAFISCLLYTVHANHVVSCEGFIKTSDALKKYTFLSRIPTNTSFRILEQSNLKVDYSSIKIELYNRENNHLKEQTTILPTGLYTLPIYDHGNYELVVKGPEGWNFEPKKVHIEIGEQKSTCGSGKDINFILKGFKLHGKVLATKLTGETETGPEGVQVTLYEKGNTTPLKTSTTTKGGEYSFDEVLPGEYTVKASHKNWKIDPTKASVDVKVGLESTQVPNELVVAGYDIRGRVVSNNLPMIGVELYLYASDARAVIPHCNKPKPEQQGPLKDRESLCIATSDEKGDFVFTGIPSGEYSIVPYYRGFRVAPSELKAVVHDRSVELKENFEVKGFSVRGTVVDTQGKGIKDVVVFVNGKKTAVTNENGEYTLEEMTSGTYTIEAQKDEMQFKSHKDLKILPNKAIIDPIVVSHYKLCGQVSLSKLIRVDPRIKKQKTISIISKSGKKYTIQTDINGKFCFQAPVEDAEYTFTPIIEEQEKEAGLVLEPESHVVKMKNEPIKNINFTQKLFKISGSVDCISKPCDPGLIVTLTGGNDVSKTFQLNKQSNVKQDEFLFENLLAGTYIVSVVKDTWCWEKSSETVTIEKNDISGIQLKQKGYKITIVSSHDNIKVTIEKDVQGQDTKPFSQILKKNTNHICLDRPAGVYRVTPESCFRFEQNVYLYDTKRPQVIDLDPVNYAVTGYIKAEVPETDSRSDIVVNVNILNQQNIAYQGSSRLVKQESNTAQSVVPATFIKREGNHNIYQYKYWASLKQEIEFTPKSSSLLFYPKSRKISINQNACPPQVEDFTATIGMFITGVVEPEIAGVNVEVIQDSETIMTVETDAQGKYVAGPLYDDQVYSVRVHKDGYKLKQKPNSKYDFIAMKLASIHVHVVDENDKPLKGVFLSLSGDGYRTSNVTSKDGTKEFINLTPGQYFLQPVLKEYVFAQTTYTLELKEGETFKLPIKGKRVGYSCFGKIKTLNGSPEKSVVVQAFGKEGDYEETFSDSKGRFRIRGLKPNHEYNIQLKIGDLIERASPNLVKIKIGNEDVHDINFIAFPAKNSIEISGTVDTPIEFINTLQVELLTGKDAQSASIIRTDKIGVNRYFQFSGIPKEDTNFYLRLKSSLTGYTYETPTILVEPTNYQNVVLKFYPKRKTFVQQEMNQKSIYVLAFCVLVFLTVLYSNQVINLISYFSKFLPSSTVSTKKRRK